jgi:hypothetical protein
MPRLLNGSLPFQEDFDLPLEEIKGRFLERVMQMIRDAERKAKTFTLNADCKLFFTANGRIGFGPSSLKIGDFQASFKDAGMDVILRFSPAEEKFVTVGTAVPYFAETLPSTYDNSVSFDRAVVDFHLDFETLLIVSLSEKFAR